MNLVLNMENVSRGGEHKKIKCKNHRLKQIIFFLDIPKYVRVLWFFYNVPIRLNKNKYVENFQKIIREFQRIMYNGYDSHNRSFNSKIIRSLTDNYRRNKKNC